MYTNPQQLTDVRRTDSTPTEPQSQSRAIDTTTASSTTPSASSAERPNSSIRAATLAAERTGIDARYSVPGETVERSSDSSAAAAPKTFSNACTRRLKNTIDGENAALPDPTANGE